MTEMSNSAPLLETKSLGMHFGGVRAVDNVDFTLAKGELRCLIGPNGAGKSTFFRCLTGLCHASTGIVRFSGKDITRAATHNIARMRIGIKTQMANVFNGLTVRENLSLAASVHHRGVAAREAVDRAIERMRLGPVANHRLDRLSHGQRQWVELAMVVTGEPVLILLDEPTAGMTQQEVEHTAELVRELNRSASLIVVEHDMSFIRSIASKVTVFHHGKVFLEDSAETVLSDERVGEIYLGKKAAD